MRLRRYLDSSPRIPQSVSDFESYAQMHPKECMGQLRGVRAIGVHGEIGCDCGW